MAIQAPTEDVSNFQMSNVNLYSALSLKTSNA